MPDNSSDVLVTYLTHCGPSTLATVIKLLKSKLARRHKHWEAFLEPDAVRNATPESRREVAQEIVDHYLYFASNSIAYISRKSLGKKPEVGYLTALRSTAHSLNSALMAPLNGGWSGRFLKTWFGITNRRKPFDVPRVATVNQYESLITEMVVGGALASSSPQELETALREAGLEDEAVIQECVNSINLGMTGFSVLKIVRLLGKKAIKDLALHVLQSFLTKRIGKEAAQRVIREIGKKIPQKVFSRAVSFVGWVLLLLDVVRLASPAKRIVIPLTVFFAVSRSCGPSDEPDRSLPDPR